jgi:hypothetical protein
MIIAEEDITRSRALKEQSSKKIDIDIINVKITFFPGSDKS